MPFRGLLIVAVGLSMAASLGGPQRVDAAASPAGAQRYVIVPSESLVTYRVGEVFINQGNRYNVATGTTRAIQGEILIDRTHPRNSKIGPITIDISQFKSDRPRRDSAIRARWLESSRYPHAVFTPTAIEGLPSTHAEGRKLAVKVTGNLKIRDVTRPTTFATTLTLAENKLTGVATTLINMTDFGFDPPSILGILKAENRVRLELQFVARPRTTGVTW